MEIQKSIPVQSWLMLNWKVRTKLANDLNIPKSSDVVLMDNEVLSDGRTQQDLNCSITVESLQEYTKSNIDDIFELFQKAVEKAEYEIYLKEHPQESSDELLELEKKAKEDALRDIKEEEEKEELNKIKTNDKPNTGTANKTSNKGRGKSPKK
ncbi:MAG: hypothetical protein M0P27_06025 [Bacteroidales bacterium]|jgi:hypothetical protein|nr:hypothetical protein [Bacteroidales bacterium]